MRNRDKWQPSKYIVTNNKLIASRNPLEVHVASRLMADLVASAYDDSLRANCKGRLLDLGCGKVPLFRAYESYVTDIVCVDWENSHHKNQYLDFECDLTKGLHFQDGEFDTIILSDVLEHIPAPEVLWFEMSRLLSPGGRIIMNVPFYYWIHEQPHDYYRYTEFALRRFVETAGLKMLELKSIGGSPEIIADIAAKHLWRVPIIGVPMARLWQWLTLAFVRTKPGKYLSDSTKDKFPLGYFMIAEKPQ